MKSLRCAVTVAVLLCGATVGAADWPQWRGPNRDAHLAGFKAPAKWPEKLVRAWSVTIGEGHSSPIIVGQRAYVLVRVGENEETHCIDLSNGRSLWKDVITAPFDSVIMPARRLGKAPRSTPLYVNGKLYITGVNGTLSCLRASDGKPLWRKNFSKDFSTPMPICGASLSPLVDGARLYIHVGHDEQGAFMALDRETGNEIWRTDFEGPAYCSPTLATLAGVRQIVTASHSHWIGLDPASGRLLWKLKNRKNFFNHNSITPVISGDTVFCGANQRPTSALRIVQNGPDLEAKQVWEQSDVTMSTSSPTLGNAILYAVNEKRRGQIVAMDAGTGKVTWACEGSKGDNVTLYDSGEWLLAFAAGGEMYVYAKAGSQLKEAAKYQVAESQVWASPAISGNLILVKGATELTLWRVP